MIIRITSRLCSHLGLVFCRRLIEQVALLSQVHQERVLSIGLLQRAKRREGRQPCQRAGHAKTLTWGKGAHIPQPLVGTLPADHAQNQLVGNGIGGVLGRLLERLVERGLGLLQPAEMQLGDGLGDERLRRRRRGRLRQLLEDVECLLVLFTALSSQQRTCQLPGDQKSNA